MKKLKRNIRRLCFFLIILLLLLILYGAFNLLTSGNRWFSSSSNTLIKEQKKTVIPGNILDRNGIILAAANENGERVYSTDESVRRAVVHVLGDDKGNVNNGVESFMARYLYGFDMSFLERADYILKGNKRKGDNVTLTIDSSLSKQVLSWFPAGKSGAVVVMNYQTGETVCEMSFPDFDPEDKQEIVLSDPLKPYWNRAVQMQKAPGSTFKVITAAAALRNMVGLDLKKYNCDGLLQVGGHLVTDAGTDLSAEKITAHGSVTLRDAFLKSCNNTFARVALEMGDTALRKMAESFGFNDNFLFRDIVVENSVYPMSDRTDFEVAWTGAGQSALMTTPMHMCMVAACVANEGVMMEPRLLIRAVGQTGKIRMEGEDRVYRRVMTREEANTLRDYMWGVITSGTGSAASVPGHRICGKTGSSEQEGQQETDAWFIGFIDEEACPYALCVTVENAGGGGSVAAPVAKRIFTYLLESGASN